MRECGLMGKSNNKNGTRNNFLLRVFEDYWLVFLVWFLPIAILCIILLMGLNKEKHNLMNSEHQELSATICDFTHEVREKTDDDGGTYYKDYYTTYYKTDIGVVQERFESTKEPTIGKTLEIYYYTDQNDAITKGYYERKVNKNTEAIGVIVAYFVIIVLTILFLETTKT